MSSYDIVVASMMADTARIESASHNIANANTTAFKRSVSFADHLQSSEGVTVINSDTSNKYDFTPAVSKFTSRALDLALAGPGFFVLRGEEELILTRAGNFILDSEGFLSSSSGERVQSENGDVFVGEQKFVITVDGHLILNNEVDGKLRLVLPEKPSQLASIGDGKFTSQSSLFVDLPDDQVSIYQHRLETSNVDIKTEMIEMTKTLKHFETQQRLLKAYDALLDIGISEFGDFQ